MKAIDIVKAEPSTEREHWEGWKNRMQAELQTLPYYHKKKIEIKYVEKINLAMPGGDLPEGLEGDPRYDS